MHSMCNCEFPPTIRNAGFMLHSFWFVHNTTHESFSMTVLLRSIWDTLRNANTLPLKQVIECSWLVFSPYIGHSILDFGIELSRYHFYKISGQNQCSIFRAQRCSPSHWYKVIMTAHSFLHFTHLCFSFVSRPVDCSSPTNCIPFSLSCFIFIISELSIQF